MELPRSLLKRMLAQIKAAHDKAQAESTELLHDDLSHRLHLKFKTNVANREEKTLWFKCEMPHPIYSGASVCLLVNDEAKADLKHRINEGEFEERAPQLKKVLTLGKLAKFSSMKARKQLAQTYDLFMIDRHISQLTMRHAGATFVKQKRRPIPVKFSLADPVTSIESAIRKTYFVMSKGDVQSVPFGLPSQSTKELMANLEAVTTALLPFLAGYGMEPVILEIQTHPLPDSTFWYHPNILANKVVESEEVATDAELLALADASKSDELVEVSEEPETLDTPKKSPKKKRKLASASL
ncbi:MAG: uncharacterized protein KVP18_000970 [Porospora cf. gigantea A]|uniref:uncharacterized protein n=1 Tax=Porospora cf. gigantea A TaxID=2853593 RepID=UPI003559EF96|nr:MAG: hypothetical protein KVP18_000970 [Porospora cf. gigantea A]